MTFETPSAIMHESLKSGSINLCDAASQPYSDESKSDDASSNSIHPWHQLKTITTFEQMTASSVASSFEKNSGCSEQFSRRSGSSRLSFSDKSSDGASFDESFMSSKHEKKSKNHNNKHHSDPSHDRFPSRQGSCSSDSHSRPKWSNHSLKRKLSSSESGCLGRNSWQQSASIDERVSVSNGNNSDNYRLAVTGTKAVRAVNNM